MRGEDVYLAETVGGSVKNPTGVLVLKRNRRFSQPREK